MLSRPWPRKNRRASLDPTITERPHTEWILPATLAHLGSFRLFALRDLESGPSRRIFLDIGTFQPAKHYTLILPLTLRTSALLTRWKLLGCPGWICYLVKPTADYPRWALDRDRYFTPTP